MPINLLRTVGKITLDRIDTTGATQGQVPTYDLATNKLVYGDGGGGGTGVFSGARLGLISNRTAQDFTSFETLSWNHEVFDDGGYHDPAQPTRLTIPAGVTRVVLHAGIALTAVSLGADVTFDISKNDTSTGIGITANDLSIDTIGRAAITTGVLEVVEGDYFDVTLQVVGDTSVTLHQDGTFFSCHAAATAGTGGTGTADGVVEGISFAASAGSITATLSRSGGLPAVTGIFNLRCLQRPLRSADAVLRRLRRPEQQAHLVLRGLQRPHRPPHALQRRLCGPEWPAEPVYRCRGAHGPAGAGVVGSGLPMAARHRHGRWHRHRYQRLCRQLRCGGHWLRSDDDAGPHRDALIDLIQTVTLPAGGGGAGTTTTDRQRIEALAFTAVGTTTTQLQQQTLGAAPVSVIYGDGAVEMVTATAAETTFAILDAGVYSDGVERRHHASCRPARAVFAGSR